MKMASTPEPSLAYDTIGYVLDRKQLQTDWIYYSVLSVEPNRQLRWPPKSNRVLHKTIWEMYFKMFLFKSAAPVITKSRWHWPSWQPLMLIRVNIKSISVERNRLFRSFAPSVIYPWCIGILLCHIKVLQTLSPLLPIADSKIITLYP